MFKKFAAKLTASLVVFLFLALSPVYADTVSVNFENPPFTIGTINAQDGWISLFGAGIGGTLDHQVSAQSLFSSFGSQSLRISNFWTTADLTKQTFSRPLIDEAGDAEALSDGFSGGSRKERFEAEWDFASANPVMQPNLFVVADLDRGDGSIMGKIIMKDTPAGLEVNYRGYEDLAPFGSDAIPSDGCGGVDGFPERVVATGLSRSIPHRIKITVDFVDGPRSDVVNLYVDGVLKIADSTWEDYYRWCQLPLGASRTVDSIVFVTEGLSGGTFGEGLYIDNFKLFSGSALTPPPSSKDQCKDDGWMIFNNPKFKNQGQCVSYFEHLDN